LEEQKFAEVANAVAAMEWAEQSGQHDALFSLYIGGKTIWLSTGGLAMAWLDRIPEPPASEPHLRSQWLSTSGTIRSQGGDEAKGFAELLEAAAIVDELIGAERPAALALSALLYRGIFLAVSSDVSAALADSDRLNDLQVDGDPRYAEWCSLMVRTNALMSDGDDAAMTSAMQMEAVGRTISRYIDDNSAANRAMLLLRTERFDEALAAAMQCLNSQVMGQTARMNVLVPAVKSLAALGRYEAALEIAKKDFGPMIDAQRARLMGSQLVSLVVILHQLQRHERITEIAGVAYAYAQDFLGADSEVRTHLADIIGGDEAFAELPTPDPAELTPDRIATLIDDLITEIRDLIAHGSPGPLAEAPTKAN
jgi:tetratricopeptide (TPR) repeat protein